MIKYLEKLGKKSKKAFLKTLDTNKKNKVLLDFANLINKNKQIIISKNKKDLYYAFKKGLKKNMIERLILNSKKIQQIEKSIKTIAKLEDPVDKVLKNWRRLRLNRQTSWLTFLLKQ